MRNVVLSSICAAAIGLSTVGGAFAQTSGAPGAPPSDQSNVTAPAARSHHASMHSKKTSKVSKSKMKKDDMKKDDMKKDDMKKDDMEKKM